jgi:osmotically-inducible protein OsmY
MLRIFAGCLALAAFTASSCAQNESDKRSASSNAEKAVEFSADNTGRNVRDRGDATLTPTDQSGEETDLKITQEIRRAIMADPEMSVNAHNIKVITISGVVTLRGPVASEDEKSSLERKAKAAAGVTSVDNELEIKP